MTYNGKKKKNRNNKINKKAVIFNTLLYILVSIQRSVYCLWQVLVHSGKLLCSSVLN